MLPCIIIVYLVIVSNYCETVLLYRTYQNETKFVQTCETNQIGEQNYALTMATKSIKNYIPLNSVYEHGKYISMFNDSTNLAAKKIERSLRYNLEPVVDKRWEDFETIKLEENTKFTKELGTGKIAILHLSFLFEDYVEVIIYRAIFKWCAVLDNSMQMVQFRTTCNPIHNFSVKSEGFISWRHFTVYLLDNDTYTLQDSTEFNESSTLAPINIKKIEFSSPSEAFVKLHDYKFLVLEQHKTEVFSSPIYTPRGIENLGICMHLFANVKCNLTVFIQKANNASFLEEKYAGESRWMSGYLPLLNTSKRIQIVVERIGSCQMTFLDDMRFCTPYENRKMVFESCSISDSCTNMDNQLTTYSDPQPLLSMNPFYSKYKYVYSALENNTVICTNNASCFCPPGYIGPMCGSDISRFIDVLQINTYSALMHIKNIGYYNWSHVVITAKNSHNQHTFNNDLNENNRTYEIKGLYMNSFYNLAVKYCTSEDCTHLQNIPIFLKTEKCLDITQENLIYTTTPHSITFMVTNITSNCCPLDTYVLYINRENLGAFAIQKEIPALSPNTNYTVKLLSILNNEETNRKTDSTFTLTLNVITNSTEENEVNNLRILDITTKSAVVSFDPPSTSYGKIEKYQITYFISRYQACQSKTYLMEKIVFVSPLTMMAKLTDLEPFAEYSIEVCAFNKEKCGKILTETFNTVGLKEINADEETAINIKDEYLNIIFPTCENVKGYIVYTIIATCIESVCEDDNQTVSFEYKLRNEYENFIQSLKSYSSYQFDIYVSRYYTKQMPRIIAKTPPGKPNPVIDLTVYSRTNKSMSLRWKPPHISTGIIEYYFIKTCMKDNCSNTTSNNSCSLWVGCCCEEINNLTMNQIYHIHVYVKNFHYNDVSVGKMVTSITSENAPERPLNVVAEHLWYGDVVLTWHHPDKTNGQLQYFKIYFLSSNKSVNETIPVKTHTAVYTHQVNHLPPFETYDVYIKAGNQYLGSKSNTVTFSVYITKTIIVYIAVPVILITIGIIIFIGNCIWKKRGRQYSKINTSDNLLEMSITDMEEDPMNTYINVDKGKNTFRLINYDLKTLKGEETLQSEILRYKPKVLVLLGKGDTEILQKYKIQISVFVFDLNNLSLIPRHIDQMKNIMQINAKAKVPIIINSRVKGEGQLFAKCLNMISNSNMVNFVQNISKKIDEYGFVFYHYYKNQMDHPPYLENKITKLNDEDERKYLKSIEDLIREIYYISHIKQMNDDDIQTEFTIKNNPFTYVVRNLELFSLRPGKGNPKLIVLLGSTPAIRELKKQVLSGDNKIFVSTAVINGQNVPVIQWIYDTPFIQKNKNKFYTFYYYYRHIIKHLNPEEIHIYSKDVSSGIVIASDMFIDDLLQSKPFDVQKIIYTMMYEFRQLTVEYVGPFLFTLFRKHWNQLNYMNDAELNFDIKSYFP